MLSAAPDRYVPCGFFLRNNPAEQLTEAGLTCTVSDLREFFAIVSLFSRKCLFSAQFLHYRITRSSHFHRMITGLLIMHLKAATQADSAFRSTSLLKKCWLFLLFLQSECHLSYKYALQPHPHALSTEYSAEFRHYTCHHLPRCSPEAA